MALSKSIATPFGLPATYWRITRQNENFNGFTEVYLSGYANQETRQSGAEPLDIKVYSFDLRDVTRQDAYAQIAATDFFADATEI